VTITVGEIFDEEQEFVVPLEHLTTVLEFFESSYIGSFRENNKKTLSRDDVLPVTFRIFVEWLNRRKLLNAEGEKYDEGKNETMGKISLDELIPLVHVFPTNTTTSHYSDEMYSKLSSSTKPIF